MCQVAGVDQDVAVGDIKGSVESVGVTDGDKFHEMEMIYS